MHWAPGPWQPQREDQASQKNRERASNPYCPLEKAQQKRSLCRSQQENNAAPAAAPEVVKQTVYLLKCWKDEPTGPFPIVSHLSRELMLAPARTQSLIFPIPGPPSNTETLCPQMNQILIVNEVTADHILNANTQICANVFSGLCLLVSNAHMYGLLFYASQKNHDWRSYSLIPHTCIRYWWMRIF